MTVYVIILMMVAPLVSLIVSFFFQNLRLYRYINMSKTRLKLGTISEIVKDPVDVRLYPSAGNRPEFYSHSSVLQYRLIMIDY